MTHADCSYSIPLRLYDPPLNYNLGLKTPRLQGEEYYGVLAEFMHAVKARWPKVLIQFEDFSSDKALTLLDKSFLATLDGRQLANGAAEIAKMALVKDPELFELLAEHGPALIANKFQDAPHELPAASVTSPASRVLYLAIQTMLEELAPNLWEQSLERLVDFGHVFSMELEMAALFDEKLFHGEAVAIDMAFSSVLAHVRGHLDSETLDLILQTMRGLSLPVYHERFDSPLSAEAIYERVKFSQGQKLPLPVGKGEARLFNDVTPEEIVEALKVWHDRCAA